MRLALALVMVALLMAVSIWRDPSPATALAQARMPAGTAHTGKAFRFNKVAEGVYHAVGTGALQVVGNSAVIVNDDDVMIVDDHVSPAAAWVLLEEVKELTPKPVRYVVNTHFHFDHAHGNQVFGPNVEIIGHEFTRQMLAGGKSAAMPLFRNYVAGLPAQIDGLRKRVAAETAPEAKAKLQTQLQAAESNAASQAEFRLGAANGDAAHRDDAPPRQPRDPAALPRPRPHGWRRRGVPAARAHRHHRRLPDLRPVEPERLLPG